MPQVDAARRHFCQAHQLREQANDLDIGIDTTMPVQFGADLQRLSRRGECRRQRVQDATAIAQPRNPLAIEQMRVDTCHLRRHVGPHAHGPPGKLIDQLERPQLQILTRPGSQRIEILQQRRHDELIAMRAEGIKQATAQAFEFRRFGRQSVLDVIRENPTHDSHETRNSSTNPMSIDDRPINRICPSAI
jgi:hypothetical protein